jgi:4-amino-4-deoxy-L-arabinose transferase-like glycosyltransferase
LIALPWLLVKPLWPGVKLLSLKDTGIRFCMAWAMPVFIAFSLISGKRVHYLMPLLPTAALLIAHVTDRVEDSDWSRAHRLFAGLCVFIGLITMSLPVLNQQLHWHDALSAVSPYWGIAIVVMSFFIAGLKADNVRESALMIAVLSITLSLMAAGGYFSSQGSRYDIEPPAQKIAGLLAGHKPVALYTHKYHGQFNYLGRLTQPLTVIYGKHELNEYINRNPEALVVVTYKEASGVQESLFSYRYPFKNQTIGFAPGATLLSYPGLDSLK